MIELTPIGVRETGELGIWPWRRKEPKPKPKPKPRPRPKPRPKPIPPKPKPAIRPWPELIIRPFPKPKPPAPTVTIPSATPEKPGFWDVLGRIADPVASAWATVTELKTQRKIAEAYAKASAEAARAGMPPPAYTEFAARYIPERPPITIEPDIPYVERPPVERPPIPVTTLLLLGGAVLAIILIARRR